MMEDVSNKNGIYFVRFVIINKFLLQFGHREK
jgi:hypothetical protein